ncbi:hypothetical protein [Stenotrophomonas maltophilia]|jgi:hypothetical protein|uniref:hypothetical protein n=1 Tax=Stenotrophomonas maltophilia TaxID=40324 RepID=UPI001F535E89|nr:hypothetical protein [Stenotrophomonas maltophilia]MCI1151924.1 hypothetical protein [Stenotrophomonas maltophilia]
MRIKDSASFPHPVLSKQTLDYGALSLTVELDIEESPDVGNLFLNGTLGIDDTEILELVRRGDANAGIMVTCRDTYYDHFHVTGTEQFRLDLSGGKLRGRTNIRAVVVAATDRIGLASSFIDPEFPMDSRFADAGDIIASSEEFAYEVGLEKLAPLESIFRLKLLPDVPEGEFQINLEGESIDILASADLHGMLSIVRDSRARDVLLSSLYLPTLMSVLEAMKEDGQYEGKRWHTVMAARCSAAGIDIANCDLAQAAQRLLDRPLRAIGKIIEGVSA